MQSTTQLFNLALARLGGEQLPQNISPQENDTVGALCRNLLPHVLDLSLSAHVWSFALRRASLAALPQNNLPVWEGWGRGGRFAYALPADCVRAVRLEGTEGCRAEYPGAGGAVSGALNRSPVYVLEGETLRSDLPEAVLLYVARVEDPKRWPPAFADALAWALAAEVAAARVNDTQKQGWCWENYRLALSEAMSRDRKIQNRALPPSAWAAARHGSEITAERF